MGNWARDGKFIYAGRRNEGGANFRAGECALFTESSAGYAGVKAQAEFDFEIRSLPYWEGVEGAPQNTIIGGSSLWVLSGHESDDYNGVAAFLNFLSSSDIQAKWHQDTGYLRSHWQLPIKPRPKVSMKPTRERRLPACR